MQPIAKTLTQNGFYFDPLYRYYHTEKQYTTFLYLNRYIHFKAEMPIDTLKVFMSARDYDISSMKTMQAFVSWREKVYVKSFGMTPSEFVLSRCSHKRELLGLYGRFRENRISIIDLVCPRLYCGRQEEEQKKRCQVFDAQLVKAGQYAFMDTWIDNKESIEPIVPINVAEHCQEQLGIYTINSFGKKKMFITV